MSRAAQRDLFNRFAGELTAAHTAFSGGESLVGPSAGHYLRVYKIVVEGPSNLAQAADLQVADGSGAVKHTFSIAEAGGRSELDFGSRYLRFSTAVSFSRPAGGNEDELFVSVYYREAPTS